MSEMVESSCSHDDWIETLSFISFHMLHYVSTVSMVVGTKANTANEGWIGNKWRKKCNKFNFISLKLKWFSLKMQNKECGCGIRG